MKVLSLGQPSAWLAAMSNKDVENRTWTTRFRGEFLIHAATLARSRVHVRVARSLHAVSDAVPPSARLGRGLSACLGIGLRRSFPAFASPVSPPPSPLNVLAPKSNSTVK